MNTLIEDAMKREYPACKGRRTKTAAAGNDFGTAEIALAVAEQNPIAGFNQAGCFPANKQVVNLVCGRGKGIRNTSAIL